MGAEIINNFDVKTNLPIDSKYVKEDVAARNAIPATERYEGLPVFIRSTSETFQLQGGISNAHWVDITLKKVLPLDGLQFNLNPISQPDAEGLMQWNNVDGTLDLGMLGGLIVQQIGLEVFIQVYNNTAAPILNGTPVYITGRYNDILPTVDKSVDSSHEIAKATVGLVTENIAPSSVGYVTVHGKVRHINTVGLTEGQLVYVGHTAGTLSSSPPSSSDHAIVIGICIKEGLTDGVILVKNIIVEEPRELDLTTGFHTTSETTISYTNSAPDRTFKIEPVAASAHYYQDSIQYYITGPVTYQWSNVEGIHYIAFNNGSLIELVNPTKTQVYDAIQRYALICQLYWDATAQQVIFFGDERHGFSMDGATHAYLHLVNGPIWVSGQELNTLAVDESGADDEHAQFGINSGETLDEDNVHDTNAILPAGAIPIFYRSGAGVLRRKFQVGFPVMTDNTAGVGASGRLVYNRLNAGVWSLEAVPTGKFVLCHVFSVDDVIYSYATFVGTTVYDDIAAARIGAETEITSIAMEYRDREFLPVATVIYETADGYANGVRARTRSAANGDYVDWRSQRLNPVAGTAASNHNALSDKQPITNPPNEFYHLTAAQHAVATQAATAVLDGYLSSVDWSLFNSKQAGHANLTSLASLAFASSSFVKMIAPNVFFLDTSTYSLSSHNHTGVYAPVIHNLIDTTNHPAAGLTIGHVIKATAVSTYEFAALNYSEIANKPTLNKYNQSTVAQGPALFSTDTYVTGSGVLVPTGSLQAGSRYVLRFSMTKTAAGTAAASITIRFGTNASTADAALLTFTLVSGSAQVDTALFELDVIFRTVGAGTAATLAGVLVASKNNSLSAQGLFGQASQVLTQNSVGFNSTIASSYIGASFNGGLNFSGTCEVVRATLENLV